ncbi:MAG: hypothetical protein GY711_24170 [bacterium]|nr:hypothetical protein [bacterium]
MIPRSKLDTARLCLWSCLSASALSAPKAHSQTTVWSQSNDNTTIVQGSAACLNNPDGITDNSFWRLYDPLACGVNDDFEVRSVTYAVETATATAGSQLIEVVLHADPSPGAPGPTSTLSRLGSAWQPVSNATAGAQTFVTQHFTPAIVVPAGTLLAVEVRAFDGQPQGDLFLIGSNTLGETPPDSSFISATDCGIDEPVPTASIGFPVHFIIDLEVSALPPGSGTHDTMCLGQPNSLGSVANIQLGGSTTVAGPVLANVSGGVPGQFGYFISGPNPGSYVIPPSSSGLLCIDTPQFRYNSPSAQHIFQFDPAGNSQAIAVGGPSVLEVDGSFAPVPAVAVGESRAFQAWYRDGPTSNFSDSVVVTFGAAGRNLTWSGDAAFIPPPTDTFGIAFGINDLVDILPDGDLPITISHTLTNTGTDAIPAGYLIEMSVVRWTFLVVAGQAAFVEGDPTVHTHFQCTQIGPALVPGESAVITFTLGDASCPINTPPATSSTSMDCGMYQVTFSADTGMTVAETNEQDNDGRRFFFVPSDVQAINIATTRDPNNDPNVWVVGQTVEPFAPGYPAAGGVATTHRFNVTTVPAGASLWVNAISPRMGALAGNVGTMTPGPFAQMVNAPQVYDYTVDIPNPGFAGPCNGIFPPLWPADAVTYLEPVNSKITVISADGCAIAQKSALVNVVHECFSP